MRKIFLYAYDKQNLGDDLFIHTITKRYPSAKFYIISDEKNIRNFAGITNLEVINKNSFLIRILNRIRPSFAVRYLNFWEARCDATVYIGGSIFMEYPTWRDMCKWWEYEAEHRNFYILGANFGPWHTREYKERMASIYLKMKDVSFRDQYSKDLFSDIFTVRYAPDILFSYPVPKVKIKEKQIFVSIINCANRDENYSLLEYDKRYVTNMACLLNEYLNNGYNLILSAFCKTEGDEEGVFKVLSAMGKESDSRIQILTYDGTNYSKIITAIAESGLVIATRFHAMILALVAGRPVMPLIYSNKVKNVLKEFESEDRFVDIRDNKEWTPEKVLKICLPQDISRQAENHFSKLDLMFKKGVS